MQKDCHYYGTFYMAYLAGFSPESAQKIAWAAQSVDQMDYETVRKLRKKNYCPNVNMVTVEKPKESVDDVKGNYGVDDCKYGIYGKYLTLIRNIWVPFHFLPGLTKNDYNKIYNKASLSCKEYINFYLNYVGWNESRNVERNKQDASLICAPSSTLCKRMILNAKKNFEEYRDLAYKDNKVDKLYENAALYYLGICMHVLADTWSHQGFCGSFNQMINDGNIDGGFHWDTGRNVMGQFLQGYSYSTYLLATTIPVIPKVSPFSPIWTGHGPIGTNPDVPGNSYFYRPNYDIEKEMSKCLVDNNERFCNGFLQMYDALHDAWYNMGEASQFKFRTIESAINEDVENNITEPVLKEIMEIKKELFTADYEEKVRCNLWKKFIERKLKKYKLKDYDVEDGDFLTFMTVAREHRKFIMQIVTKDYLLAGHYSERTVDKYFKGEL